MGKKNYWYFVNLLKKSALRYGLLVATIVQISQNPMGYKLISFVALILVENLAILQGITLSIISMSIFHMFKRRRRKKKTPFHFNVINDSRFRDVSFNFTYFWILIGVSTVYAVEV